MCERLLMFALMVETIQDTIEEKLGQILCQMVPTVPVSIAPARDFEIELSETEDANSISYSPGGDFLDN